MNRTLRALWRFDEEDGPVAFNAVPEAPAMQLRGAFRGPGPAGRRSVVFTRGGDAAFADGLGDLPAGAVCLHLWLDRPSPGAVIVSLHDQLRLCLDAARGDRLVVRLGKGELAAPQPLTVGSWTQVAVAFGPTGLSLDLDGRRVGHDPAIAAGVTGAAYGGACFVTICGLPSQVAACAVADLAVFDSPRPEAAPPPPSAPRKQPCACDIDAGDYLDPSDPTCGLQRAIDAAAPAGGRVRLPVGRFELRRSLDLHSRITLVGAGHQSVLAAAPGFVTTLTKDVAVGDTTLALADAGGFRAGDAVCVQDDAGSGYNATHAIVAAVEGDTIHLSQPAWFAYRADPAAGAVVARWFSALRGLYVFDVQVADLAVEGRAGIEPRSRVNFTASAITLERSLSCQVRNVLVRNWLHDGICFGKGSWHRVSDCVVRDGYGHGFHPGNRMRSCTWRNNIAVGNGQDGFYFCCGVEDNLVSGNLFEANAGHGIADLGGCNDLRNLVTANQCVLNGRAGIHLNGGRFNTVTNNLCRANSQAAPGTWAGIHVSKGARDAVIAGNHLIDDQPMPTQREGVFVEEGAEALVTAWG